MKSVEASEPDSSNSGHVSPFQAGKRKAREEDEREKIEQVKRMMFGGIAISNTEIPNENKIERFMHHNEEEDVTSQINQLVALPLNLLPPRTDSTVLNLNSPADIVSNDTLISFSSFHKPYLPPKHENTNKVDLADLGVDLNDPFYPYKKLGQVRSRAASECGSTTGSVEISESMRKWNEMKQNGFVSTVQVKASIPRLKRCESSKKNDELKKIIHMTKQEQHNKATSVTDPSQLLSGLHPGIIKHVRNSKQVNSIIKAMLQNEILEKQHGPTGSLKRGYNNNSSEFNSECDDDALTLKLSYSGTTAVEHASKRANDDFSTNQEDISSLSINAANVALQWLTLISHDITARMAAIQRSKKRVKNAIEMELPCLFSRDLDSKQENELSFGLSLTRCSEKESFNVHLARWKAVFTQMEVSLTDEKNQLEKWLRQVEELKSQCQEGLRYVNTNGFLQFEEANEIRILKNQEAFDKELAVRAAAASIYSTCNAIMTAENLPSF